MTDLRARLLRGGVTDLRVRVLRLTCQLRVLKLRVLCEVQTCKVRVADSALNGQGCSSYLSNSVLLYYKFVILKILVRSCDRTINICYNLGQE